MERFFLLFSKRTLIFFCYFCDAIEGVTVHTHLYKYTV